MPDMFFPYITGKGFFFRLVVEIMFAAWLILAIRLPEYRPKFSWVTGLVTIFTVVMLGINLFAAVDPSKAIWSNFERMEGWILVFHLWMYYIVISSVLTTREWWKKWIVASLIASFLVVVFAFTQLFIASNWYKNSIQPSLTAKSTCMGVPNIAIGECLANKFAIRQGGDRVDSTLGNAIYLAAYMMIHMFLAVYLLLHLGEWKRKRVWQYSLGVLIVLQFIVLIATATRGTAAGLLAGALLSALLIAIFDKQHATLRKVSAGIIILAVVAVGILWSIRSTAFVKNNYTLSRFASVFSLTEIKSQARIAYIWPIAFEGFKERPVLGWGQDGFNYVFNKYYNPDFYYQEQWFDRAHNVFLDWLIAGGLVGLGLYLSLYVAFLVYVWKSRRLTIIEKSLFTGLLAAYTVHNMLVFDNLSSYILFFSLLGLVHVESTHGKDVITKKHLQIDVQNLVAIPLIVILGLLMVYFMSYKPMRVANILGRSLSAQPDGPMGNLNLFKKAIALNTMGKQEVREQLYSVTEVILKTDTVSSDVKQQFFSFAIEQGGQQALETPEDARGYYLFAGLLNRIGQSELGYQNAMKALEYSPQKQTMMFELAMSLVQLKRYDEAIAVTKKAYDSAPKYEEAKVLYAAALIYGGKLSVAEQLYDGTLPLTPRIVQSLEDVKNYQYLITRYKAAVKANPTDLQARLVLASEYYASGDKVSAIVEVQEIGRMDARYKAQADKLVEQIRSGKLNLAQ